MEKDEEKKVNTGKRGFLKKAAIAAFSIPTIQTFTISELHAAKSWNPGQGTIPHQ